MICGEGRRLQKAAHPEEGLLVLLRLPLQARLSAVVRRITATDSFCLYPQGLQFPASLLLLCQSDSLASFSTADRKPHFFRLSDSGTDCTAETPFRYPFFSVLHL